MNLTDTHNAPQSNFSAGVVMNTDTPERVTLIPIDRIEVPNSRDRNAKVFEEIVENIQESD